MTVVLRPSDARGHADHGWLDTRHSFSFADYYDPQHMGFRALRVINEDVIKPAKGFGTHGHRDMEILTYIIDGALEHRDSTGEHSVIRQGEVQRMSAGTGIRHSEFNASASAPVKLLQIWLLPERDGIAPGYEQKLFAVEEKHNQLCLIAATDGRDGALRLHQDADVYASLLDAGHELSLSLRPGRGAWVQVVDGSLTVNGQPLAAGDGAAIEAMPVVEVAAKAPSQLLIFDLG